MEFKDIFNIGGNLLNLLVYIIFVLYVITLLHKTTNPLIST